MQVTTTLTILASETDSNAFWCGGYAQAIFILPATFQGDISFKVSNTVDGTFVPFYDKTDTLVSISCTQDRAYAIPIDLFPAGFIKLVSSNGGGEGADRTIIILAKY